MSDKPKPDQASSFSKLFYKKKKDPGGGGNDALSPHGHESLSDEEKKLNRRSLFTDFTIGNLFNGQNKSLQRMDSAHSSKGSASPRNSGKNVLSSPRRVESMDIKRSPSEKSLTSDGTEDDSADTLSDRRLNDHRKSGSSKIPESSPFTVESPSGEISKVLEKKRSATIRTSENDGNPEVSSYNNLLNVKNYKETLEESYKKDDLILDTLQQKDTTTDIMNIVKEKNLSQPEYYIEEEKPSDEKVNQLSIFLKETPNAPKHLVEALEISERELIYIRIPSQEEPEEMDQSPRKFKNDIVYEVDEERKFDSFDEERGSDASLDDFKKETKKIQIKKNIPEILSKDPMVSKTMLEGHVRSEPFIKLFESSSSLFEAKNILKMNRHKDPLNSSFRADCFNVNKSLTHILFSPITFCFEKIYSVFPQFQEDLYCSVTLYSLPFDRHKKSELANLQDEDIKQISETFKFQLDVTNPTALSKILNKIGKDKKREKIDYKSKSEQGLFTNVSNFERAYFFFKFSRGFKREETETINDFYVTPEKFKQSQIENSLKKIKPLEKVFEDKLTPFAWGCCNLFDAVKAKMVDLTEIYQLNIFPPASHLIKCKITKEIEPQAWNQLKTRPIKLDSIILLSSLTKLNFGQSRKYIESNPCFTITPKSGIAKELLSFDRTGDEVLSTANYMYIYPRQISLPHKYHYKNIYIEISLHENDEGSPPLKAFFDPVTGEIKNSIQTELEYKNYNSQFTDEIKMLLPSNITKSHHILFKFHHAFHKLNSKIYYSFIGYQFVDIESLVQRRKDELRLPVYIVERDVLKPGYRGGNYDKYDGGKKVFHFGFSIQSTVHVEHSDFKPFFDVVDSGINDVDNGTLIQALRSIANIKKGQNMDASFLLLILENLFKVLDSDRDSKLKKQAFLPLMHLFDLFFINDKTHAHLFAYYIKYVMNFPNVHEEILGCIVTFIENNKVENTLLSLPYFNSILMKSMILKIKEDPKYEFSKSFRKLLHVYVSSIASLMMEIYAISSSDNPELNAKKKILLIDANGEIGSLLRFFLSFVDRSSVLQLISTYSSRLMILKTKKNVQINLTLQILFYQEIFKYSNYMLLFLPKEEGKNYFLFNGFIEIFKQCMNCEERDVRFSAIITFRELILKTTNDPRYEKYQKRISKMFLHLIEEFLPVFPDWKIHCEKKVEEKTLRIRSSEQKIADTEPLLSNLSTGDPKEKLMIEMIKAAKRTIEVQERDLKIEILISKNEKKHLFTSLIQILESLEKSDFESWFQSKTFSSQFMSGYFLNLLQTIVESFAYLGTKKLLDVFEGILVISKAKSEKEAKTKEPSPEDESGLLVFNIQPGTRLSARKSFVSMSLLSQDDKPINTSHDVIPEDQVRLRSPFLKQLCHRSSLFVFEVLNLFIEINKDSVFKSDNIISNSIEDTILKIFISYLSTNQSESVLVMILCYLKYFMSQQIHGILKIGEKFSKQLMNLCQSQLEDVRRHASATYYLFVRFAFEATKGISRPKLIATRSLSKILDDEHSNKIQLVKTFKEIQNYPIQDTDLPNGKRTRLKVDEQPLLSPRDKKSSFRMKPQISSPKEEPNEKKEILNNEVVPFKEEIESLGQRLKSLLNDTVAEVKNKNSNNTYGYEELLIRISNGYSHVPQLRIDWLIKLADHHTSEKFKLRKNFIEAAECYVLMIRIAFDMIKDEEELEGIPVELLIDVNPYPPYPILASASNDESEESVEEQTKSEEFSQDNLIRMIEKAADLYNKGEFYEKSAMMNKLLLSFYEKTYNYQRLSEIHEKIMSSYKQIHLSLIEKRRFFPSYYRIGFYGKGMKQLNGKQFIYKMKKNCKLYEVVKLVKEWTKEFGNVQLIEHSGAVKPTDIKEGNIYAQITYVQPYIDPLEPKTIPRKTKYQKNTDIHKFFFETSYKPDDWKKADANDIEKSQKKRTILVAEHHFPSLSTRLPIISESSNLIISPIECACEIIEERNSLLDEILSIHPIDLSQLQLQLSGAVQAKVNGGPCDYVEKFLGQPEKYPVNDPLVIRLNTACKIFLQMCKSAVWNEDKILLADKTTPSPTVQKLHEELQKGYQETKDFIERYIF